MRLQLSTLRGRGNSMLLLIAGVGGCLLMSFNQVCGISFRIPFSYVHIVLFIFCMTRYLSRMFYVIHLHYSYAGVINLQCHVRGNILAREGPKLASPVD